MGRATELARLHAALTTAVDEPANPGASGIVVQALHGLGGIGKSTLAARYIELHPADFTQIVWLTADSVANLETGLAQFAVTLEPELAGALPSEALRERAISWLCTHTGWLLVLDNVTHPDDVRPLLARATTGHFLLTSRQATGWHNLATPLRLDVLEPDEAQDLITRIIGPEHPQLLIGAEDLCERLGYLPLAVEQAAAYMAQNAVSAAAYLELLELDPMAVFADAAEGTAAERTLARVWTVSLDALADDPLCGRLLRVLAWLSPEGVPRELLMGLAPTARVVRALGRLGAYSMLALDAQGVVTVHRLVQEVARTPHPGDPHRDPAQIEQARDEAARLLHAAIPGDVEDLECWPAWRALAVQVAAFTEHAPAHTDTQSTAYLLDRVGSFLYGQGTLPQALSHLHRAVDVCERLHDSEGALASRNNLAVAYRLAGDYRRAAKLHERTVTEFERVLGPEHPQTLQSRNNLASAYHEAGDHRRATELFERTVTEFERVLGPEHPQTLQSRNNLASAYQEAGDHRRATELHERTLADRERILGPEHPDTLTSRNNLANAYHAAGNYRRATELHEQTLAIFERALGPNHPHSLTSRENLRRAREAAELGDSQRG